MASGRSFRAVRLALLRAYEALRLVSSDAKGLPAGASDDGEDGMDAMGASEYWDDQAAVFDEAPDHGLRDPAVRDAWAERLVPLLPPVPARGADLGCGSGIGLKVLTGQGAAIDTTTAAGKLVFGIFAALAEFERELISERTIAGLASARTRGRTGGRPFTMTPAKVRLAMASMGKPDTKVNELCRELGISRQALYRHFSRNGEARPDGMRVLARK